MKRIVISGPESSGKTTLAEALAHHYGTVCAREMARPYLEVKKRSGITVGYAEEDLLSIARSQVEEEDRVGASIDIDAPRILFCDTDLITIRIWGEEKYGRSDPWIAQQTEQRPYDLWFLCAPDMPWEPDPLRENPHDRDRLFDVYERTLMRLGKPYMVLRGTHEERMRTAMGMIDSRGY